MSTTSSSPSVTSRWPRLLPDRLQGHAVVYGLVGPQVDAEVPDVGHGHHVGGGREVEGGGGPVEPHPHRAVQGTAHLANRMLVSARIGFDSKWYL